MFAVSFIFASKRASAKMLGFLSRTNNEAHSDSTEDRVRQMRETQEIWPIRERGRKEKHGQK